jgi:hypothetical protein
MNLLEGVVPGWRTRSNDATSDILMNRSRVVSSQHRYA